MKLFRLLEITAETVASRLPIGFQVVQMTGRLLHLKFLPVPVSCWSGQQFEP